MDTCALNEILYLPFGHLGFWLESVGRNAPLAPQHSESIPRSRVFLSGGVEFSTQNLL